MDKKAKMLSELEELKMAEKDSSTPAEALDGIREAITNLQKKIDGYKERKPKAKAEPKEATKTATVKKPRGTGKPNPDFAKVQQIAKNLKAKDPSLKHTKAVSMAWAEVRGGALAKTTKTAEKAPEKKAEPKKLDKLKVTAKPNETAKKAVVKKASEAPKKKNDLIEKVKRAKAKVKRVGKTYSYKQNGEVRTFQRDKKKDGLRTAKHVGKRVSKEGNVYYEYRDNRADVNIGKVSYKRPSLYAKGGVISMPKSMFEEAKKSIEMGYNIVKVGMISPKRKGVVLMNEDYQVRGTFPLEFKEYLEYMVENKFAKGGILDAYDQKAFKEWLDDGNVSKNPDGTYSTQDAQYQNRLESLTELKKYFKKEILEFAKGGKTKGRVVVKVRSYNYQNTILMEMAFETERQAEKFADKIENYNDDGYVFSLCGYDSTGKKVVDIYDLSEYSKSDVKKEKGFADCTSWSLKMKVLDYRNVADYRNTVIYEFTGSFDACFRKFNLLDGEDLYADYKSSYAKGGMIDLFEDYENIPEKVAVILDRYKDEFGEDMDYQDTQNMLNEIEAVGYTFDYYLDNVPYGLRPIGTPLSDLQGYEDEEEYAKGGEMDERDSMSYARTKGKESIDWDKELREYVGSNYSKLSEREKKEIISDMQKDFDRRYSFADGGKMDDENQRFDVNPNVTSTLANLQPYLDGYTMRKFGSKFPPETIFVEYYKRPDGTAQIEAVTLSNFTGSKSKRVTVDEIFETYARGGRI